MPYEYHLEPKDSNNPFPQELIEAMHKYMERIPNYVWKDGTYTLFRTVNDRDRRIPKLLTESKKNDYLDPLIHIKPHDIMLSAVADPETDQYLYDFVLWCQEHWPCQLYYDSEPVSPEDLTAEP